MSQRVGQNPQERRIPFPFPTQWCRIGMIKVLQKRRTPIPQGPKTFTPISQDPKISGGILPSSPKSPSTRHKSAMNKIGFSP